MSDLQLVIVAGPALGGVLDVVDELVLGRDEPGLGGLQGDPELSRRHARIRRSGTELVVEDLGSTNGTFVNGQRIAAPTAVRPGDLIQVGGTTLEVRGQPALAAAGAGRPAAAPSPSLAAAAPQAPPAFGTRPAQPAPARTHRGRVAAIAAVCALVAAAAGVGITLAFTSGTGSGSSSPEGAAATDATTIPTASGTTGIVAYVERNVAEPDANAVLAIRFSAGDMRPLGVKAFKTGGSGSADLTDSGVLDADQHIAIAKDRRLLLAVNQGSDTIAVFHIGQDGDLTPVNGSPFPSGGKAPVSIGISGDTAVVANKAQDGIRDLTKVPPTYASFRIGADGALTSAGPAISLPAGTSPTQAYVVPGTNLVVGTEESGPLVSFAIGAGGQLAPAPGSPQDPDPKIFGPGFPKEKEFALGVSSYPSKPLVYIGMPTVPAVAVYGYDQQGLHYIDSVPDAGVYLPCWTVVTPDGRFLYTSNADTNNVTAYDLSDPTEPTQIQVLGLKGLGNPWDEALDATGKFLFVITPRDTYKTPPGEGNTIHVLRIGGDGTLSELNYSPLVLPVPAGTNPQGMAVFNVASG